MKIAVPVTRNNQVDEHFGHCEFYNVYTVSEDNKIEDIQSIESVQGCGCKSNIASVLYQNGVTKMLAGGIGAGAINVLNSTGIEVIRGCSGIASDVVNQYINGLLEDSGSSCQTHEEHHAHGNEHVCNN